MEKIKSSILQALIITGNEEPNIERVLNKLSFLENVVVLDSYSTDLTISIIKEFPNVSIYYRTFDSFARQCNYGLSLIDSQWILSLDADYVLSDKFIAELKQFILNDEPSNAAYQSRFEFLIYGRQLLNNNTTPRPVLFRKNCGFYIDDGHAHRLEVQGNIGSFTHAILHDDRKSLSRWIKNQDTYSIKECNKLLDPANQQAQSTINKIRRTKIFAPILVFFYCAFFKGLLLNGWAGWYYILQRTMVEMLWALRMIENENFNIKFEPSKVNTSKTIDHSMYYHEASQPVPQKLPNVK